VAWQHLLISFQFSELSKQAFHRPDALPDESIEKTEAKTYNAERRERKQTGDCEADTV